MHGCVWDEELSDDAFITDIVVAASERRTGVGRRLLTASLQNAFAAGYPRVCLFVEPTNVGSIRLMRSVGMSEVPGR